MSILSKQGVKEEMKFKCHTCGDTITGKEVLDGTYLYIVKANKEKPENSSFRCECCQDDFEDQEN
jgi:transposase-like protein